MPPFPAPVPLSPHGQRPREQGREEEAATRGASGRAARGAGALLLHGAGAGSVRIRRERRCLFHRNHLGPFDLEWACVMKRKLRLAFPK